MAEKKNAGPDEGALSLEVSLDEMDILMEAAEPMGFKDVFAASPVVGKNRLLTLQEEEWENLAGLLSKAAFSMESSRRQALLDNLIEAIEELLLMDDEEDETD